MESCLMCRTLHFLAMSTPPRFTWGIGNTGKCRKLSCFPPQSSTQFSRAGTKWQSRAYEFLGAGDLNMRVKKSEVKLKK